MKKIKFSGKLSLNKETIAKLNNDQMNVIKGGAPKTMFTGATFLCQTTLLSKDAAGCGSPTPILA